MPLLTLDGHRRSHHKEIPRIVGSGGYIFIEPGSNSLNIRNYREFFHEHVAILVTDSTCRRSRLQTFIIVIESLVHIPSGSWPILALYGRVFHCIRAYML